MKAIQEEAEKYAMHYSKEFLPAVLRKEQRFQEHYETCRFDHSFFEELLYTHMEVAQLFSEKRLHVFGTTTDQVALQRLLDQEEQRFIVEIGVIFKEHFVNYYIEEIEHVLEECQEEMTCAKEDYVYYKNRDYIKDKAFLGEVSEEERTLFTLEATERITSWSEKKQTYETIQKELNALISHV